VAEENFIGSEQAYVVEAIRGKKKVNKRVHYLVKWEGHRETSWEPAHNIKAPSLISKYNKSHKKP